MALIKEDRHIINKITLLTLNMASKPSLFIAMLLLVAQQGMFNFFCHLDERVSYLNVSPKLAILHNQFVFVTASSQERPDTNVPLSCYECNPENLGNTQGRHDLHMTQMKCLTEKGEYGELKKCQAFDGACASGEISKYNYDI